MDLVFRMAQRRPLSKGPINCRLCQRQTDIIGRRRLLYRVIVYSTYWGSSRRNQRKRLERRANDLESYTLHPFGGSLATRSGSPQNRDISCHLGRCRVTASCDETRLPLHESPLQLKPTGLRCDETHSQDKRERSTMAVTWPPQHGHGLVVGSSFPENAV